MTKFSDVNREIQNRSPERTLKMLEIGDKYGVVITIIIGCPTVTGFLLTSNIAHD